MSDTVKLPCFLPGRILATPSVLDEVPKEDLLNALRRHLSGDWGCVCEEDRSANNRALAAGDRLFSAYRSSGELKFWIITEADRSATTILLPEEY